MTGSLSRLEVENYRQFQGKHTFELVTSSEAHIIIIQGPDGAGKTTLIEAIKACLYDEIEVDRFQPLVSLPIVEEADADERVSGSIAVTIETSSGDQYRISRSIHTEKTNNGLRNEIGEPILEQVVGKSRREPAEKPEMIMETFSSSTIHLSIPDGVRGIGINTGEHICSYHNLLTAVKSTYSETGDSPPEVDTINSKIQQSFWTYLECVDDFFPDSFECEFSGEYIEPQYELNSNIQTPYSPSTGRQMLVSYALLLAAGDAAAASFPLLLDNQFAILDNPGRAAARKMSIEAAPRQLIITTNPYAIQETAKLQEWTAAIYELEISEN
jgi:GTPase SAR1 family protein